MSEQDIKTKVLEIVREAKKRGDLSKAKIIVAGGRGVGDAEGFKALENLAEVLGGRSGRYPCCSGGGLDSRRSTGGADRAIGQA